MKTKCLVLITILIFCFASYTMAQSKYQIIPPLSTVKKLDPALRKILQPMIAYMNAQMGVTGAKLDITGKTNPNDFKQRIVSSNIKANEIATENMSNNSISEAFDYYSETPVALPSILYSVLGYTSPVVPTINSQWQVNSFIEVVAGTFDDVTDKISVSATVCYGVQVVQIGTFKWTESGSGTSEYYLTNIAGTGSGLPSVPNLAEDIILENSASGGGTGLTVGTVGTLSASECCYDDNDALGFDTIYVRLADSTDPDTKADGYVRWAYVVGLMDFPYFTGYMASDAGSVQFPVAFSKRFYPPNYLTGNIVIYGYHSILAGALAASAINATQISISVTERKGK